MTASSRMMAAGSAGSCPFERVVSRFFWSGSMGWSAYQASAGRNPFFLLLFFVVVSFFTLGRSLMARFSYRLSKRHCGRNNRDPAIN